MRNPDYFRNKKVTVIGLARSGLACANLLYNCGAEVSLSDSQDNPALRQNLAKLKSPSIKVELGKHSPELIQNSDLIVVSPGVPANASPITWAKKSNIPVVSEIEVAWRLSPATLIAVTGSNGKTTATTLIGRILQAAGKKAYTCGNIGNPFCGEVEKIKEGDFVALEASSFQLETIDKFKPQIALILNFSRNHLDRYRDMQEYLAAKKRIFRNQESSDYLVLNRQDPALRELEKEAKAKTIFFQQDETFNQNQAALLCVASILGVAQDTVLKVFQEFKGIEHRLEYVSEIKGIKFINDSKATTVEAAAWALNNIPGQVILIAGGRDKGNDYRQILDLARKKVKQLIVIGEARKKMQEAFRGYLAVAEAATLDAAVKQAYQKGGSGDYVLLSPMCSSFDMFSNYEERGTVFKRAVSNLK